MSGRELKVKTMAGILEQGNQMETPSTTSAARFYFSIQYIVSYLKTMGLEG